MINSRGCMQEHFPLRYCSVSWNREYTVDLICPCRERLCVVVSKSIVRSRGGKDGGQGNEGLVGEVGSFNRVTADVESNQHVRRHFRYFDHRS